MLLQNHFKISCALMESDFVHSYEGLTGLVTLFVSLNKQLSCMSSGLESNEKLRYYFGDITVPACPLSSFLPSALG